MNVSQSFGLELSRTGLSYDSSGEVRVFVNLATCNGSQITSTVDFFFWIQVGLESTSSTMLLLHA